MAKSDTQDATETQAQPEQPKADAPKADKTKQDRAQKAQKADKAQDSSLSHDKAPLEMSLKGFLRASGQRPDQTAGFESFAARQSLGRRTLDAWQKAFADFHAKPL